jgi:hypothetical protein
MKLTSMGVISPSLAKEINKPMWVIFRDASKLKVSKTGHATITFRIFLMGSIVINLNFLCCLQFEEKKMIIHVRFLIIIQTPRNSCF